MTEASKDGTTDALYVNGALVLSQGGKLATIAGCQDTGNVGRGYNDNTYFTGDIAEVLVYNRALSQGERQAVEAYLNNKYAVIPKTPPQITTDPASLLAVEPAAANFSVTATGTAPLAYQWRRGGVNIGGATGSSYTLSPTSVASDNGAQFRVVVTNASGSVTSSVAALTVTEPPPQPPSIVSPPAIVGGSFVVRFGGTPGRTYTIEWSGGPNGPWAKAVNLTAPLTDQGFGVGVFEFSEPVSGVSARFYRALFPSY